MLGDEDLGPLYDLLIDESPLIRHAVGDLVYDHLIAQKFSSSHATGISLPWSSHLCIIILVEKQLIYSRCQCIFAGSEGEGSEVQISRLLQILREFASDPILSDYVIDAVWQGMDAIKAIFTLLSVNFLIV